MESKLFKVNVRDLLNGLVVAVGGAVFMFLADLVKVPGFDFYQIPWGEIGRVALLAFGGYLGKKFFSDSSGSFGGVL